VTSPEDLTDRALRCCGVRIDASTPSSAVSGVMSFDRQQRGLPGRSVHLCNAYTLSLARHDDAYRALLNESDLNLPDGMPLIWIARRLGIPLEDRVYGPTLMLDTLDRGREAGLRHYLYGGSPEVIEALPDEIERRFPGVTLVGAESPPFRPLTADEKAEAVARMVDARPDVVWVGLGTPKQDEVVHDLRKDVPATMVAVGAAFDFIAGSKRQAPSWMQEHGLEWAFRLATEPRRLWRRYLVGNTSFLLGVATDRPRIVGARTSPAEAGSHDQRSPRS
jgi:N-acetylglucosaminyldiphosphoundecaprenol N-acetyl-beta-D-mannosaminyltransferase